MIKCTLVVAKSPQDVVDWLVKEHNSPSFVQKRISDPHIITNTNTGRKYVWISNEHEGVRSLDKYRGYEFDSIIYLETATHSQFVIDYLKSQFKGFSRSRGRVKQRIDDLQRQIDELREEL